MMRSVLSAIAVFSFLAGPPAWSQPFTVSSPDGLLTVTITETDGRIQYEAARFGRAVIEPSRLGLQLDDGISLAHDLAVTDTVTTRFDETWEQVWGEKRFIRNQYNEMRVELMTEGDMPRHLAATFRVYDDGFGFRYEVPEQPHLGDFHILDELTEFSLTEDPTAWWIGAYQWNRYEYLYEESALSEAADTLHTPLTIRTTSDLHISIHEAALTDYSSMTLARKPDNVLEADLVPWSDGVKVRTAAPMVTPWRTVQIADTAGDLIESTLILNLNEPNRLTDTSWIEPGKYVGIWWEMHLGISTWGSGPNHGATTEKTKEYIDFAAEHGFDGVLVEGWNVGWDGDWMQNADRFSFTEPYPDFDMNALAEYAHEKGTRLIGHHETAGGIDNYEAQLDDAFAYYRERGIRAVKTGYVAHGRSIKRLDENGDIQLETHHGQYMVEHYRRVVEAAARHGIMLNVHEPVKPTGIRRTWPNMMTREGARGQEFNSSWGDGNGPAHTLILPFTRLLGGPMDFTPGIFQLTDADDEPGNSVPTTLAGQLALYVTLYSPLHMAADLPRNYREQPEAFRFIVDVPTDWQDTHVLHAEIGDYMTIVRKDRNSEDWYLGSTTDEEGRLLDVPLYFLEKGVTYVAEVYHDSADADWETNPLGFEKSSALVDRTTTLTLRLAPGGGMAIRFRQASPEESRNAGLPRCTAVYPCDADFRPESR